MLHFLLQFLLGLLFILLLVLLTVEKVLVDLSPGPRASTFITTHILASLEEIILFRVY